MSLWSFYLTNQMHNINYMQILKANLQHISVQVYHVLGGKNAVSKHITNYKLLFAIFFSLLQRYHCQLIIKLHLVKIFKNLQLKVQLKMSCVAKYMICKVKLLLLHLVVKTSSQDAPCTGFWCVSLSKVDQVL